MQIHECREVINSNIGNAYRTNIDLFLRHCILHKHGVIIFCPHGFVFLQRFELFHVSGSQFKIKNVQILLHALVIYTLRNYDNAALNILPERNLHRHFPVGVRNLLYNEYMRLYILLSLPVSFEIAIKV